MLKDSDFKIKNELPSFSMSSKEDCSCQYQCQINNKNEKDVNYWKTNVQKDKINVV